jgi:hypothetical protein
VLLSSLGSLEKSSTKNYKYDNVASDRHEAVMGQRVRSIYLTFLEQSMVPTLTNVFEEQFH